MSYSRGGAPMQHPFDDPFIRDPFSMMNQMMGNMHGMMGSMFNDPFFNQGGLFNQGAQFQFQQQRGQPARRRFNPATVEEVHDDHPITGQSSQPIIEEPDDDGGFAQQTGSRPGWQQQQAGQGWNQQQQAGQGWNQQQQQQSSSNVFGGAPVYAYSSSSVMSNLDGVAYEKSTTARMGPGGTKEVRSTERDGRTGKESISISRALGDRARTITRTRDASGAESSQDLLRGLSQEEANRFDQEWQRQAEQNLLLGRGAVGAAPYRHGQMSMQQQQQQLPSSGGMRQTSANHSNYPGGYQNEAAGRSRTFGRQV